MKTQPPDSRECIRSAGFRLGGRVCSAFLAVLLAACAADRPMRGPMPVRNQHPAQLAAAILTPQGVTPPEAGALRLQWRNAYTSYFHGEVDEGSQSGLVLDGELLRTSVAARIGVGGRLEFDIELPAGYASGGFLDGFVIAWHDVFHLPSQERDEYPRNQYQIEGVQQGQSTWGVEEDRFAMMDLPIGVSWNLVPIEGARRWGLALRGQVELPTGADEYGFGSGGFDWVLGANGEIQVAPISVTVQAQYSWVSTPDRARAEGLEYQDVWALGAGVEWPWSDTLTALAQTQIESSVLRQMPLETASTEQWLLWLGLRARLGQRWHLEFGFGEDLSFRNAPDFTAWMMLEFDIGG